MSFKVPNSLTLFVCLLAVHCTAQNGERQWKTIAWEDKIVQIETTDDSIYGFLMIDFGSKSSEFVDYYAPGILQSTGTFNVETYDNTIIYQDLIVLYQYPIDGTAWPITHQFHAKKQGLWKYYFSNGNLHYTGNYDQNLRDGEWMYYGNNGEIELIREYEHGIMKNQVLLGLGVSIYPED